MERERELFWMTQGNVVNIILSEAFDHVILRLPDPNEQIKNLIEWAKIKISLWEISDSVLASDIKRGYEVFIERLEIYLRIKND